MTDATSDDRSADKVTFELASPEALLISTAVDMVVVPGSEGDFGVLPGHAPFISAVRPGVIDIYQGDKIDERVFIAAGFAEVDERRCTVLSSEAYPLEDLANVSSPVAAPTTLCPRCLRQSVTCSRISRTSSATIIESGFMASKLYSWL